jgi:hypothetical protein
VASPDLPEGSHWRKTSFTGNNGTCVEVAALADGGVAVRNSNDPHGPIIVFTRAEMHAWIEGCRAGEFDDLT